MVTEMKWFLRVSFNDLRERGTAKNSGLKSKTGIICIVKGPIALAGFLTCNFQLLHFIQSKFALLLSQSS